MDSATFDSSRVSKQVIESVPRLQMPILKTPTRRRASIDSIADSVPTAMSYNSTGPPTSSQSTSSQQQHSAAAARRSKLSDRQRDALEAEYALNKYPSREDVERMQELLMGPTVHNIRVWFQNRRSRDRQLNSGSLNKRSMLYKLKQEAQRMLQETSGAITPASGAIPPTPTSPASIELTFSLCSQLTSLPADCSDLPLYDQLLDDCQLACAAVPLSPADPSSPLPLAVERQVAGESTAPPPPSPDPLSNTKAATKVTAMETAAAAAAAHSATVSPADLTASQVVSVAQREPGVCGQTTSLHLAVSSHLTRLVIDLLHRKSDVNAVDEYGRTPLHLAAASGQRETLLLLLSFGADVNAPDCRGYTPLHELARLGQHELVALLLMSGADISARACDGHTPVSLASCGSLACDVFVSAAASVSCDLSRMSDCKSVEESRKPAPRKVPSRPDSGVYSDSSASSQSDRSFA